MRTTSHPGRIGHDLTEGPIFQNLMLFAIPMIGTNIIQQLYSMADLAIIGQFVGSAGTVGVSTGGEIADLLTPVAASVSMAGQVYIAQLVGSKDGKRVKEALGTMLTFMLLLSVFATFVPILFWRPILRILNCPEEAITQARDYMVICSLGMPFVFGYNAVCAVLRGMGEAKRPLFFVAVAATVNVFLDILLVAVIPLEAAGTAIATVCSQIGACVAAFSFLHRNKEHFGFELKLSYFNLKWEHLSVMLKLGIPQLIRSFCVRFSMLWVKANINAYGLLYSSTYSIGNKLEKFVDVFFNGVTGAGSAMIGQNLGARKIDRVKKIQNGTLLGATAMGLMGSLLFLAFPKPLFRIFTEDMAVLEYGVTYCRVMALACVVHAIASSYKCMATGAGEAMLSFFIGVFDGISRVIVCYIAVEFFDAGVMGYYLGAALCHLLPGLVSFGYYVSGKWKTKKLLAER